MEFPEGWVLESFPLGGGGGGGEVWIFSGTTQFYLHLTWVWINNHSTHTNL